MERTLSDVFEQARKFVAEADRKRAEDEEHRHEREREAKLIELSGRVEAAFDFTNKERLELDPRLELKDGKPVLELVVQGPRAIFVLEPQASGLWTLTVIDEEHGPQRLGEFRGGVKTEAGSRRLAAARIVTTIGYWTHEVQLVSKKASVQNQPQWQDQAVPSGRRQPAHRVLSKFLRY